MLTGEMQQERCDFMEVLFLSYSDVRYDGRLRELLAVAEGLGNLHSVIKKNGKKDRNHDSVTVRGVRGLLQFLKKAKQMADKMEKVDILFLDNRMACIPGLLLSHWWKDAIVIQDVRELYLFREQKAVKGKAGCLVEKKMIEKSDIVICANRYRAQIMKKIYSMKHAPLVYENIRKLSYESQSEMKDYQEKYKGMFRDGTINLISTSGADISRTNDRLVSEMRQMGKNVHLFMVGGGKDSDCQAMKKIIRENKLENVHLIGKVGEGELKYLISQCQIGIVNYGKQDTNNRLCASGKIYEFLFEGLPVVTTSNLPLRRFCEKFQIGAAGDSYAESISQVIQNYERYQSNAAAFAEEYDVAENNRKLLKDIKKRIDKDL